MQVITQPSAEQAVDFVARLLAARIRSKPDCVLGLATGRTMESVYEQLAGTDVSFRRCRSFNLDEYVGLTPNDVNSYRHYMHAHLFSKVDIDPLNTHVPDGSADDLKAAAVRYEQLIVESGGIDVQLLGIGEAGHIGFNEPLSSIMSRTRDKSLTLTTRAQNAAMFGGDLERVPKRALTMGVGTILDARELVLLATGSSKAAIVAQAVEGPVTSMVSASAIQLHPDCKVVIDQEAAADLQGQEYYNFVLANEGEQSVFL